MTTHSHSTDVVGGTSQLSERGFQSSMFSCCFRYMKRLGYYIRNTFFDSISAVFFARLSALTVELSHAMSNHPVPLESFVEFVVPSSSVERTLPFARKALVRHQRSGHASWDHQCPKDLRFLLVLLHTTCHVCDFRIAYYVTPAERG